MDFYTSAFFWAFVALCGLHGATFIVSGHRIGRHAWFAALVLTLVTAGRVILVLPFCEQPRFVAGPWQDAAGVAIVVAAVAFAMPAMTIRWWSPPEPGMELRTTGPYSFVRHPIYTCEVLWPIGWSLMWGSIYGLALTPVWWIGFLLHAVAEEDRMEAVLDREYKQYEQNVRGRFLPGLPF